jgi:alpha-D-ribose 1-methylphosphonate 5-triphosphate synthase subunit PhnI
MAGEGLNPDFYVTSHFDRMKAACAVAQAAGSYANTIAWLQAYRAAYAASGIATPGAAAYLEMLDFHILARQRIGF